MRQICKAFEVAKNSSLHLDSKATVIVANTIPGKGYIKIENDYQWHGKPVNKVEMQEAIDDMKTLYGRLTNN
jgi:transketolase